MNVFRILAPGLLAGIVALSCADEDHQRASNESSSSSGGSGSSSGVDGHVDAGSQADSGSEVDGNVPGFPHERTGTPSFSPPPGTYSNRVVVLLSSATVGAKIFFSLDGSPPTTAHPLYTAPIEITSTTTIRALAVSDRGVSAIASGEYVLSHCQLAIKPPSITPPSGGYAEPIAITMSTETLPSTICYTVDGSIPTCDFQTCTGTSTPYSVGAIPFTPTTTPTTFRAIACGGACDAHSSMSEVTYTN